MKKIVALITSLSLYAAPIGNPSAPKIIQEGLLGHNRWDHVRIGYEGDFVADGRMEQYNQGTGRVDLYQQWTNSGTFTLDILNRLDLEAVFGASHTEANWRFENLITSHIHRVKLTTKDAFLWSVASRVILCEWGRASLGLEGLYSSCNPQISSLTFDGTSVETTGAHLRCREWLIGLGLSYQIDLFTPYIGTKYSNAKSYLENFSIPISSSLTGDNSFQNRLPVGVYVGCSISNGKYFMLNLEGRVIDEEAISISGDFEF